MGKERGHYCVEVGDSRLESVEVVVGWRKRSGAWKDGKGYRGVE